MILCKNLSFGYEGQKEILKSVSFEVKKGQIAVLLGLNGCGKTTLLNCIGSNYKQYSGEIKTDPNCKYIKSLPEICENLTGIEYIEMLMSLSHKINQSDIDELINSLGIRKILDKKVKDSNIYTRNLLMLLSSLCIDSNTIILDDPFSKIDRASQLQVINIIKKLKDQGKTVLIATNVIYSGFEVADELLVLHRGRVKQFKNLFQSIKQYEGKVMPLLLS